MAEAFIIRTTETVLEADSLISFKATYDDPSKSVVFDVNGGIGGNLKGCLIKYSSTPVSSQEFYGTDLIYFSVPTNGQSITKTVSLGNDCQGKTYYFYAWAYDYVGSSDVPSVRVYHKIALTAMISCPVSVPGGRITNFSIIPVNNSSNVIMTFDWTKASDINTTGYVVRYRADRYPYNPDEGILAMNEFVSDGTLTSVSKIITNLDQNQLYYFRIWAYNVKNGKIAYSNNNDMVVTTNIVNPMTLASLTSIANNTSKSVTVNWKFPNDPNITGVVIVYSDVSWPTSYTDGTVLVSGTIDEVGLSKVFSGNEDTTYYIRAWTYNTQNGKTLYNSTYSQVSVLIVDIENRVFTKSGMFVVPNGWNMIQAFLVGGGGGSDGVPSGLAYGASGAGGGHTLTTSNISVDVGQEFPVVVGTGGLAGQYTGSTDGGDTIFNNLIAKGGKCATLETPGDGGSGGGGHGVVFKTNVSDGYSDDSTEDWWTIFNNASATGGLGGEDGKDGNPSRYGNGNIFQQGGKGQTTSTKAFGQGTPYSTGGKGNKGGTYHFVSGASGTLYGADPATTVSICSGSPGTGNGAHGGAPGYHFDTTLSLSHDIGLGGNGGSGIVIIRRVD